MYMQFVLEYDRLDTGFFNVFSIDFLGFFFAVNWVVDFFGIINFYNE